MGLADPQAPNIVRLRHSSPSAKTHVVGSAGSPVILKIQPKSKRREMNAPAKLAAIFLTGLAMYGCTRYIALTRADSVSTVSKAEPITVTVPDGASAIEQRTAAVVREEMVASGFNVTEKNPKIGMIVSVNRQVTNYGYDSINWTGWSTTTTPHNVNEVTMYLKAVRLDDPKKLSIWDLDTKTRVDMFGWYIHSIAKNALEFYGTSMGPTWITLDTGYKSLED